MKGGHGCGFSDDLLIYMTPRIEHGHLQAFDLNMYVSAHCHAH